MAGACDSKKAGMRPIGRKGHTHESSGESLKYFMWCDDRIIFAFRQKV